MEDDLFYDDLIDDNLLLEEEDVILDNIEEQPNSEDDSCSDDSTTPHQDTDSESGSDSDIVIRQPLRLRRLAQQKDYDPLQQRKRKINSLEQALDYNNYGSAIPHPSSDEITKNTKKVTIIGSPTSQTLTWTTKRPNISGQRSAANVMNESPGVRRAYSYGTTMLQCWELMMTASLISKIVEYTNQKIFRFQIQRSTLRKSVTSATNATELRAFFGLMYLRSAENKSLRSLQQIWDRKRGRPEFRATMSLQRYRFLCSQIRFDDGTNREERRKTDKFCCFREIFEQFFGNCNLIMAPEAYVTIDETLYPYRGRVGFRQYNKNKPAKYGILFRSMNAVVYPYTYYSLPYAGQPKFPVLKPHHHITKTDEWVKNLVEQVGRTNLKACNITFDRFYTSLSIVEWLLNLGITSIGTVKGNRKGLKDLCLLDSGRSCPSSIFYKLENQDKLTATSYVTKTKSGEKNIVILASHTQIYRETDDKKKKPAIFKLYDYTKGGTDVVDQKIHTYSVKTKTKRWSLTAFSYTLDTARVNAQTIYAFNNHKHPRDIDSYKAVRELGESLIGPQILKRYNASQKGVALAVQKAMKICLELFDIPFKHYPESVTVERAGKLNRTVCAQCQQNNKLLPKESRKIACKLPRTTLRCKQCNCPICKEHLAVYCENCSNDF